MHAIQGCTELVSNLFFIVILVVATKLTYYVLDRKQQDLMDLRELGKFKDAQIIMLAVTFVISFAINAFVAIDSLNSSFDSLKHAFSNTLIGGVIFINQVVLCLFIHY